MDRRPRRAVPPAGLLSRQGPAAHPAGRRRRDHPPRADPRRARGRRRLPLFLRGRCADRRHDGAIAGVRLASGETLPADAVMLACGGFQANAAMMREHFGPDGGDACRCSRRARISIPATASAWRRRSAPISPASRTACTSSRSIRAADNQAAVVLLYPYGIVVDRERPPLLRRRRGPRARDLGGVLAAPAFRGAGPHGLRDPRHPRARDPRLAARHALRGAAVRGRDARRTRQTDRRRCGRSRAHGRGLQRRLHRRSAKIRRHGLRRPRRVVVARRRRNRTGRAPSPSRRSSPGR